jgi:flagellar basal-body rod protein FlgF
MSRGVYIALSGAVAQEHALEATATNLANSATLGYQRIRPVFREVLATASRETLHFSEVSETGIDTSRGAVRQTGRPLDVALAEGEYLAVSTPRGERYTRAGALVMAADGTVKTASGVPLAREDGSPIQISPVGGEPAITPDGSITQNGQIVAKLKIVKPGAGTTLSHEGAGLLASRGPAPAQVTAPVVDVGVLEDSNASTVSAMTELVTATRTFEAFQRMLDTFGDCDRKVLTTTGAASE